MLLECGEGTGWVYWEEQMGRDSYRRCASDNARCAESTSVISATVRTDGDPPRRVVVSQSSRHGFVIEDISDLPVGCEVTIELRSIGRIRGRVEGFGQGRLLAGFYVGRADANPLRAV